MRSTAGLFFGGVLAATFVACSGGGSSRGDPGDAAIGIDAGGATDAGDAGTTLTERIVGEDLPRFGVVNEAQLERMVNADPDEPFYMINLIRFRDLADYRDGRETNLTGREADALYSPLDILSELGASPVFVADVSTNLSSGDGTNWHQIAIVHYPSRAAFLQMIQRDDYRARAVHKDAGVEKSIVLVAEKMGLPPSGVPPDPVYPPTPDDPAFAMTELLHFRESAEYQAGASEPDRTGKDAVDLHDQSVDPVASALGIYPRAWFAVEGVFIGDAREWDEFRIQQFPSRATYDALISDPAWQGAQHHRAAGLEDVYVLRSSPLLDGL